MLVGTLIAHGRASRPSPKESAQFFLKRRLDGLSAVTVSELSWQFRKNERRAGVHRSARRREDEDGRKETGGRRQEIGDRRQEIGDRR